MDGSFDFARWTPHELACAEQTADRFLAENHAAIWQAFARQGVILEKLIGLLRNTDLSLEQRLNLFARIGEVSQGLRECADGFFELGSEPVVARVLSKAEPDTVS